MKTKKIISLFLTSCLLISGCFSGVAAVENAHAASVKSRVSVHDPSIFKDNDGTYYVFGSHIEAAKTNDLQNWTRFTNGYTTPNNAEFGDLSANLAKAFAWSGENLEDCEGGYAVWAPDVIYNPDYVNTDGTKGAYLMYFCTSSTYMCSVIGFATAQKAEGPYTFVDTLIYSGFTENDSYATSSTKNVNRKYTSTNIDELIASGVVTYNSNWFKKSNYNNYLYPNAIDPTIYYDTDGKMYMCYGSWSGGIFTLEIDPATGRCIHPKTGTTFDSRMVDSYFGTKISGGYFKSGEGPFMEYNPDTGYYYLWVTYGGLTATGGYNMRVFRSENPDGPFYDAAGNPAVLGTNTNLDSVGLKVMGNYQFSSLHTAYMACGHNSVLRDDDGKWYLFYHTRFNNGTEFHEVRVHSMYFNEDGWPVVSPYEYSGNQIAQYGYEAADIAGEYEYINHGNDTSSKIHNYSSVTLSTDGTISGAVSGTWSQAQDSAAAVLTIDGQKYSGYFLAAQDENGRNVMSFTTEQAMELFPNAPEISQGWMCMIGQKKTAAISTSGITGAATVSCGKSSRFILLSPTEHTPSEISIAVCSSPQMTEMLCRERKRSGHLHVLMMAATPFGQQTAKYSRLKTAWLIMVQILSLKITAAMILRSLRSSAIRMGHIPC